MNTPDEQRKPKRRNIFFKGGLWDRIQEAARLESVERGEHVSAAAWLNEAAEEKLAR